MEVTQTQDAYPSRIEAEPQIRGRQDPVIHSATPPKNGLTTKQAAAFERDGFISIPSLFSPEEVAVLLAELESMSSDPMIAAKDEAICEPNSGIVRSIFRVHGMNEVFGALARDERILNIVRHLLDDDTYIHQSRVNMKPGFDGKEFYWHSDFETWHVEDGMPRMRAVSVSIALTENNEFNGPLMLMPGSHLDFISCVGKTPDNHYKQSLRKQEYGVPDRVSLAVLADKYGIVAPKGPAGSVTIFDCNTMHGSNGNISPWPRSNAFFVYNSITNRVVEPFGGMKPRPEFIAARENIEVLEPLARGSFAQMVS